MTSQPIKKYLEKAIEPEEAEVVVYGLKIVGSSMLTAMIIILLGLIKGQTVSAFIYLTILILLRRNVGGYHSNTYIGCLLITSLNFLLMVFIGSILHGDTKEIIGIVFLVFSTVKIYKTRPSVHKNKVVDEETIGKSNLKNNIALSIIVFIAIIFYIFTHMGLIKECDYFFDISISLIIVALSTRNGKEEGNL